MHWERARQLVKDTRVKERDQVKKEELSSGVIATRVVSLVILLSFAQRVRERGKANLP